MRRDRPGRAGIAVTAGTIRRTSRGAAPSSSRRRCRRTIRSSQRARLGVPVIRRAEALGEAVSGGTTRGDRRHARQDHDDRDDDRGARRRRVATRPGWRAGASRVGRATSARAATRCSSSRRTSTIGRSSRFARRRRRHERRGRPSRHLSPTSPTSTRAFAQFVAPARTIVLCADDAGAPTLLPTPASAEVMTLRHRSPDARLVRARHRVRRRGTHRGSTSASTTRTSGDVALRVPGAHNVRNALAAARQRHRAGRDARAAGARARRVRGRRASLPATRRRARRAGGGRLRAPPDRDRGDARRGARRVSRSPHRRRVPAAPLHAHARLCREFGRRSLGADAVFLTEIYPARETADCRRDVAR